MRRRLPAVLLHLALIVGAVATIAPIVWMFAASFMTDGQANAEPPPLLPQPPTLDQYRALFTRLDIGRPLLNSTILATAVTAISLLLNSMAGYAFARLRFRGRDRVFSALLAALVIPAQVAMLPLFLMLKTMGLVNTYLGVIVPGMASIFGIFLVRQFALSIPQELLDAARVDGASEWRIYRSVVLPLLRPILVTLGVFVFMGTWNDFMWPLIVLTDDSMYTLPVALANLMGEHFQDTELMMAGAVVTVLPVLILFLAMQRSYIEGIMMGSLKE